MEKIIDGHLVGFESLQELGDYEDLIWRGGGMSEVQYYAYDDTPSKKECARICEKLSGEIIKYKIKKPL